MRRLLCIVVTLAVSLSATAQGIGLYQSVKGFGFSCDFARAKGSGFDCVNLLADTGDVLLGRSVKPGIKASYNRLYEFAGFQHPMAIVTLYAGPGICAGRVRDAGYDNFGLSFSACGTFGCRIDFDRGLSIRVGLSTELGAFMRKDSSLHLDLYHNGLIQTAFPFIIISLGL